MHADRHTSLCAPTWMRLAWGLLAGVTGTLGAGGALAAPHTIVVRNEAGQPVHPAAVSVFVDGTPARAAKGAQGQMAQRDKAFAPTFTLPVCGPRRRVGARRVHCCAVSRSPSAAIATRA